MDVCPACSFAPVGRAWLEQAVVSPYSPRIAIVDDDVAVLESTRFLLEAAGHVVETFASPCAFLTETAVRRFDCLILDQHMPRLTGLELACRLRARGITMPIMLMTGSLTPDIVTRAGQIHLEKIVEKPASEAALMEFIEDSA